MSEFRVNSITNKDGSAGPQVCGVSTFSGKSGVQIPSGPTEFRGGRGRGVFGGGYNPTMNNVLNFVEIATTGNAQDFGDLSLSRKFIASSGDSTRGLFMGGETPTSQSVIDYVTISSSGGANDFGDLTEAKDFGAACNSNVRGIYGGGHTSEYLSEIDSVIIQSTGEANKFGD